ncbi:MAG TPA: cryptochrome/photolyase family protein [Rhodospirillaceae bacterium]|jgi:deoxyribodipyrimidine photolyase-related protein|nr:cryptochrome/photolyase family protein [Alphaproteobacteria bacterium]HBH25828.1 cryptochrome/photolyase family protein [Rhodospirillaceae bacterium]
MSHGAQDLVVRVVLGDQLTPDIAALRGGDRARDVVCMAEVAGEAGYVPHHKKKLAFVFSAMRHFAQELKADGWRVDYMRLDAPGNTGSLAGEIARARARHKAARVVATAPGEWRVLDEMRAWADEIRPDARFLCAPEDFARWAKGRKQLRMEHFYREMRRRHDVLMEGDAPAGGRWNFDADNRKPLPPDVVVPRPFEQVPDATTRGVLDMVARRFSGHFGNLEPFAYAVTRPAARAALAQFVDERLPRFGVYQDAMAAGDPWLFHAHIGLYLNAGLLAPMEAIDAATQAWADGHAPLAAVEGFVRQILGWREFVRGVYWHMGPDYTGANALGADRPLPAFYWTGDTDMRCLAHCVADTRAHAYAHHIQRLMVLGNFALLAGLEPRAVQDWFLAVYADAYEWVEAPNVVGMALYADGGVFASKPYAAGGAYINRMSDYCAGCAHSPKSCPFTTLYWDFLDRNRGALGGNPRMGLVYKNWDRRSAQDKDAIRARAAAFLASSVMRA